MRTYELVNTNDHGEWNLEYVTVREDGTGIAETPNFGGVGIAFSNELTNPNDYMRCKLDEMMQDGYNVRWEEK